ncbi:autotransporter outer membrane beta-barrel domain-containing protein [Ancylobacter sp. MQZ15Z-1]|uniref:Autotransporter outer membrane beta-barrel domain-containing protein n=1 Tax=Ancylobacter mangrovi TaxID=2972472 RepID=A0A9X2PG67_9HYPH|nr:autotransporter outer membrane beta-barrel domain-containing protein [Ancylobacter mangrovi]MCS0496789.1 autotransporter outer membrane beta-barrel domain-containing protein [Ancylobacter mangrovi]
MKAGIPKRGRRVGGLCGLVILALPFAGREAHAQSVWDPVISDTYWYVTVPQMLAFASPSTSFANPIPVGDQTLWSLGTSTNGVFTGTSSATLAIGPTDSLTDTTIQGLVTPDGEITMVFTPTDGGTTTIGIGRMQVEGGTTTMEMQMITGTDLLVSHWAYMVPYDPATFTPPAAQVVPSNLSPQWAWTEGTPWRIVSPAAFGTSEAGTFIITGYKSGYFWGQGVRPDGTTFTLLGSITPQGRVLFNTLTDSSLMSLYGGIEGDASTAQMLLGAYDETALFTGDMTYIHVVSPYQNAATATANWSAVDAARTLYAVAGTEAGLTGAMAPVTSVLNDLSGYSLSAALSETLPVLTGAATQATANVQRMLGQVVSNRLAGTDAYADRTIWVQPLGGAGSQAGLSGNPGYDISGGGFAMGADTVLGEDTRLGGLFAFSSNSVTSNTDPANASIAASSANLKSYVLGLYGSHAIMPGLDVLFSAKGGLVDTSTSRSISFMGSSAEADYDSRVLALSAGLRKTFAVGDGVTLMPTLRLDYLKVDSDDYQESGAGPLDLSVQSQDYSELFITAELALRIELSDALDLTAHGSAGYNTLDTTSEATAAFAGGGGTFVVPGAEVSPWLFGAGVGITSKAASDVTVGLFYDAQASDTGYFNQIGSVKLWMRI